MANDPVDLSCHSYPALCYMYADRGDEASRALFNIPKFCLRLDLLKKGIIKKRENKNITRKSKYKPEIK